MAKPRIREFKNANFSWIHIVHPTALETKELAQRFKFEAIDLTDVLPPLQRPKIVERPNYIFMILLFPVFNRQTRRIHPAEVDFFIGKDFFITATSEDLFPLSELFVHCQKGKDKGVKQWSVETTPVELLYEVLSRLEQYCFPISIHINNDIDKIENEIFNLKNKTETINEVLRIKTNIVNFRKAMNRHTHVIQKFLNKAPRFFAPEKTDKLNLYFKDLAERSEDLWQMLESYQDTIDAVHESHLSLINHHSNVIMQIFTIFTTVIFSVELVISWVSFDLDTLSFQNNPAGFLAANAGLLLVILMMVIFFKKRNWI